MAQGTGHVLRMTLAAAKPWQRALLCVAMVVTGVALVALVAIGHVGGVALVALGGVGGFGSLQHRLRSRREAEGAEITGD